LFYLFVFVLLCRYPLKYGLLFLSTLLTFLFTFCTLWQDQQDIHYMAELFARN
jgi:hypothetical protein